MSTTPDTRIASGGREPHITITPEPKAVVVHFNANILASTREALILREGSQKPVYYIPKKHVSMEFLLPTDHHTTCPHKGTASYWSISAGGHSEPNAVWGYDEPKDAVAAIAGHVAFYPNKVVIEVA